MSFRKSLMGGVAAIVLLGAASGADAAVIFTETFDNPADFDNPSAWTTSSINNGRIRRTGVETTAAGAGALLMDTDPNFSGSNSNSLNEAILTLDLSTCGPGCWLEFSYAEWRDNNESLGASFTGSKNGDGVAISEDGTNWFTVLDAPESATAVWQPASIDLSQAAAGAGISLGPNFKIKFQQFGDDSIDAIDDGRGYDEVVIASHEVAEPATMTIFGLGLAGMAAIRRRGRNV